MHFSLISDNLEANILKIDADLDKLWPKTPEGPPHADRGLPRPAKRLHAIQVFGHIFCYNRPKRYFYGFFWSPGTKLSCFWPIPEIWRSKTRIILIMSHKTTHGLTICILEISWYVHFIGHQLVIKWKQFLLQNPYHIRELCPLQLFDELCTWGKIATWFL